MLSTIPTQIIQHSTPSNIFNNRNIYYPPMDEDSEYFDEEDQPKTMISSLDVLLTTKPIPVHMDASVKKYEDDIAAQETYMEMKAIEMLSLITGTPTELLAMKDLKDQNKKNDGDNYNNDSNYDDDHHDHDHNWYLMYASQSKGDKIVSYSLPIKLHSSFEYKESFSAYNNNINYNSNNNNNNNDNNNHNSIKNLVSQSKELVTEPFESFGYNEMKGDDQDEYLFDLEL